VQTSELHSDWIAKYKTSKIGSSSFAKSLSAVWPSSLIPQSEGNREYWARRFG